MISNYTEPVEVELTQDIMWLSSSTVLETCLRQGDVYAS